MSPIRRAIAEQEETDRSRTIEGRDEARKSGRPSAVLETWAADYEERWAAPEDDAKPWSSRYPDDRWAEWAEDYLRRVRDEGTAYGVQGHITRERAWGNLRYETVRSRVKRMRNAGWIVGEGHLVKAGPRLIAWRSRKVRPQSGKRSG